MKRSSLVSNLAGLAALAGTFALAVPAAAVTQLPQTTMDVYTGSTAGLTELVKDGFNGASVNTYMGVTLATSGASGLKGSGNGVPDLTISMADDGGVAMGFGQLIIGLNATKGSPVTITGEAIRADGSVFTLDPFQFSYSPEFTGVNLFRIQNVGNLFSSLTLDFSTHTSQIKYLYTTGVSALPTPEGPSMPGVPGVPEPAVWGMMILGFGLVGVAARRRSKQPTVRLA